MAGQVDCHGVSPIRDRERLYTTRRRFACFRRDHGLGIDWFPNNYLSFFLERDPSELGDHVGLELDVQHKSACRDVIAVPPKSVIGKGGPTRLQVVASADQPR
jgi:hypothetical protein